MQGESEEDGAAIIAGRFFSTYGPASEQDLRRWLGVEARVSRSAVGRAVAQGSIFTVRTEMGDMYVGSGNEAESLAVIARVWLLGRFDATVLAYQDKTWVVDEAWKRKIWTNNADVRPVVLVEGRAVGIWKWRAEKEGGVIRIELFYLINDALEEVVNRAKEVGLFYGGVRKIVIEMDGATIVEERVVVVGE